ncbi:DUF4175 family protein [Winogradskyella sp. SYSU M77433]|uniref:DUF4175 family protein n=1 Tax=Winogradskyella sp. SYSU M77433 TaxID=3042722 RepID=UPI002480077F|nr:DUF4175 family protein [Winogradskyella sp. SYSU M77433]MDH7913735.1 hypothetical protein [Winogradskyella sp. SYSU M77433]
MSNFETIKHKLEQFIKRYYTNELLKGVILFFAIGLLYLLITLFVEYVLWLNPTARTILFWVFIAVEVGLFVKFIAIPLAHLFKIRKGIGYDTASKLIGNHFPEVNDKLLNVLQLNQNPHQSDLLIASIEQKSQELQPIPFKSAINFKSNTKYLKYAAIPVVIIVLSYLTGKINWFSDSYERVVNYKTAYEPQAPFQFFVVNESLQAIENKDFKLNVSTVGEVIPENAQIEFNGQTYFLQQVAPGEFQYTFSIPKTSIEFTLEANGVVSKTYKLNVVNTPNLVNFEMVLDYPVHTKKQDEVLKSTGSAVIPEGTNVTWRAKTKSTTAVHIYAEDTLNFKPSDNGDFEASKRLYKNYNYSISTSNKDLRDYENLAYNINVVKDVYPELNIKVQKDSLDNQTLYFYGQANDDYGLTKLNLVYYPSDDDSKKVVEPISISKSNFAEFVSAFPNQFNLEEGVSYQLYFEVFDNDAIHNYKRTKSSIFSYRKLTKDEEEQKQLNEQNETIKDIGKTFEKLDEQDKKLEEFSKTQKEKQELNFNDKKKFEDFLKRQKQQEQLMKNFNKKLQENLEEFQEEKKDKDEFKEDLKERLKENEEQLKKDEKLLEELEQLKDKINKEEFTQKLEELAKQNKNKKRSMQQLLELTKRFYVMKKTEKIANQLQQLSEEQKELSEKSKEENNKQAQEKLNKKFEDLQKDLDELKQDDRQLQKPTDVPRDEFLEDEIEFDQKEAKDALEEKENSKEDSKESEQQQQKAQDRQKKAAKKMMQMSEMMMQSMSGGGGGGDQTAEDVEMLRKILENLLLYSFDQEALMNTFDGIDINNNKYGKYIIQQSNLREHFEHIDDSLFALSLRQPKISEQVNTQITDVYFNIDKALGQFTENRIYQGVSSQQYAITATNELASFLSDVLDNMEMQMNPSMGSGGGQGQQLPDIIMSQEELNKQMEEGVKKNQDGSKEGEGEKPGEQGKEGEQGKGEESGKQGQEGQQGQQGESGQSGENGQSGDQQGKSGQNGKNGQQNGEGNQNGEGGEQGKQGKEGKNGKSGNGGNGNSDGDGEENDGYGEGGREEQNAELFKIYQRQQQLRQALEDRLSNDGTIQSAGELIKQMEDIELDLLNSGFTNQTLQKMMNLQHQLLKLENATFMQGQDTKRKSETNTKDFNDNNANQINTAKEYFNTTEILNRQALPLQNHFKKKIQEYFKKTDD